MDAWHALPDWLAFLISMMAGLVAGWAGGKLLASGLSRLLRRWRFPQRSVARLRLPLGLWVGTSVAALLLATAELAWFQGALRTKVVLPVVWVWGALIALDLAWEKYGKRHARTRPGFSAALLLVRRIGKGLVIVVGVAYVLGRLGLPLGGLFVATGALSAALAFAARSPLENFFAFLNLTVDPPFVTGDEVRLVHLRGGPQTRGRVQRIGLQSTLIQVKGRSLVSIPNAHLSGAMLVENLSARDRRRVRLSLELPRAVPASDLEKVCEGVEASLQALPQRDPRRPARVWISGSSGDARLETQIWLKAGERELGRLAEQHTVLAVREELERLTH